MTNDAESEAEASSVPLLCDVCGEVELTPGVTFDLTEAGTDIPDDDGWYFHVHEADLAAVDADADGAEAIPVDAFDEWYLFCPECAPSKALPTADEDPQFDIDVFIEQQRDARDDG